MYKAVPRHNIVKCNLTNEEKVARLKRLGVNIEVITPETSKMPSEYGPNLMLGRVPSFKNREQA